MRRFPILLVFAVLATAAGGPASAANGSSERGKDLKIDEIPDDAGFVVAGSVSATGGGVIRTFADLDVNGSYEKFVQEFAPYGNVKVGDGVRVALGDFNGDGNEELVTAAGAKAPVKVFELASDGTVGDQILSFGGFNKGAFVAAGDLNGDGSDELVAASNTGGAQKVVIRSDPTSSGIPSAVMETFQPYASTFMGGVTLALGNTDNLFGEELITAPAAGKGKLKVWSDADADRQVSDNPLKESFFAYGSSFAGGVTVGAGQIENTGGNGADIAVAPASGTGKVRILTDANASGTVSDEPEFESFSPYGPAYAGGVRVGVGDSDGSGTFTEVLTEAGTGAGTRQLKIYDDDGDAASFISDNPLDSAFVAYPHSVTAGAYVAFGKVRAGVYTSPGFPQTIPDPGTLTSSFSVPKSAGRITDLDIGIALFHSFDGDLDVTLTHVPTGTSVILFEDVGGTNEGFNIRLNDEAGTDIGSASNPKLDGSISGIFNPEGAALLSVFDGEDASGVWSLAITDDTASDSGTLWGWTLYDTF